MSRAEELHRDFGNGFSHLAACQRLRTLLGMVRVWAMILKSRHRSRRSSRCMGDRPEASSIPLPHLRTCRNQNNMEVMCGLSFSYIIRLKKNHSREKIEKKVTAHEIGI